jgi:phage-related protein
MADEIINYNFEGDSSGLIKAAQDAVNALSSVEKAQQGYEKSWNAADDAIKAFLLRIALAVGAIKLATPLIGSSSSAVQGMTTAYRDLGAELATVLNPIQQTIKGVTEVGLIASNSSNELVTLDDTFSDTAGSGKKFASVLRQGNVQQRVATSAANVLRKATESLKSTVSSAWKTIRNAIVSAQVGRILGQSITAHNDYIEAMNMFTVAAGAQEQEMQANLDVLSEYGGLARSTLTEAAGGYKLLAQEMGVTAKTSAMMSNNLTNVTVDLASMFNKEFVDVAQDMESALQGQTKTARKYGIDISEAGLQVTATRLGIQKSVETMTQAEKVQLRYATIVRQTSLAQSDFARTIESPANMIKILKEQLIELKTSLGAVFDTLLRAVLPVLITFAVVLQKVFDALARLTGYKGFEGIKGAAQDADESSAAIASNMASTAKSTKDTKKQLAGFDELNNLSTASTSSGQGAGEGLSAGADYGNILGTYDNMLKMSDFMPNIRKRADEIYQSFASWAAPIKSAFSSIGPEASAAMSSLKQSAAEIGSTFANLLQADLVQNVAPALKKIVPLIASITSNLSKLFKALSPIIHALSGIVWDVITAALQFINMVVEKLANSFTEWQGPMDSTFESLRTSLKEILNIMVGMMGPILDTLLPALMEIISSVMPPLMDALKAIFKMQADLHKTLWPIVSMLIELLTPILSVLINLVSTTVSMAARAISVLLKLLNFVLAPIYAILKVLVGIIKAIIQVVNAVVQAVQKAVGGLFDWLDKKLTKFLNSFIDFLNNLLGGVEKGINFILKGVNKAIKWVNKKSGFNISELHVSTPKIPKFATGGFPEDGLFYANKGELVGSFDNGRTAVANNAQIISGIEGGVARGMAKAMQGKQGTVQANVYLGADLIFSKMIELNNQYKRRAGHSAFA